MIGAGVQMHGRLSPNRLLCAGRTFRPDLDFYLTRLGEYAFPFMVGWQCSRILDGPRSWGRRCFS
jgi:hypothetical protein